jgi:hypothetical protein
MTHNSPCGREDASPAAVVDDNAPTPDITLLMKVSSCETTIIAPCRRQQSTDIIIDSVHVVKMLYGLVIASLR